MYKRQCCCSLICPPKTGAASAPPKLIATSLMLLVESRVASALGNCIVTESSILLASKVIRPLTLLGLFSLHNSKVLFFRNCVFNSLTRTFVPEVLRGAVGSSSGNANV